MSAGQIQRQEFEYERHGIVNFLALLNIYTGQMRSSCLDQNDSEHLCRALPRLLQPFHSFQRVPPHLGWWPQSYFSRNPVVPAISLWLLVTDLTHASACFLAQPSRASAQKLRSTLSATLALWESRQQLIDHLYASAPEYNRLWAQPINWSWTRRDLHQWAEKKSAGLC